MASLEDIRALLEKQAADFEAKMADALAAQEARLVVKFEVDKGKTPVSNPINLEEGEPSHEADP